MKNFLSLGVHSLCLIAVFFMMITVGKSLRPHYFTYHGKGTHNGAQSQMYPEEGTKEELGMELYPTGSSLPDCSHACGPCSPCKRVMVSFKCSTTESCPVVYRCMCKGKYYHVPSN
ncbi:unnamed protein product [Ilex paraguariensis]|uniref:Epidermal patterning factor-like protein n=1 Tax=Ilex paraguariensis TaxID=185542 RepID=A0ABC8UV14_9AQUA